MQHEIMLNTFSRSLIIWEPAIETNSNKGPGNEREPGNERGELNSSPTLKIIL